MDKDELLDRLLIRSARPHRDAAGHSFCLEAETLAAWMDGSLTEQERISAVNHAADCERCQAMLGAMARTTPPRPPRHRLGWFSLRWAVPTATASLAIATWLLVQGSPEPPPAQEPAKFTDRVTPAESSARPEQHASARNLAVDLEKKAVTPQPSARSRDQVPARTEAIPIETPAAEKREAAEPRPGERPPAPAAPATLAAPSARADAAGERAQPQFRAAAAAPRVVVSPNPNIRWRFQGTSIERSVDAGRTWSRQPGDVQEHLTRQKVAELIAGASPAPTVCWLVGTNGLVFLSTDGETWRRVEFPDPSATLVGVTAPDGLSAVVTTADGRTYRTADGGRTWALQENPAAPF